MHTGNIRTREKKTPQDSLFFFLVSLISFESEGAVGYTTESKAGLSHGIRHCVMHVGEESIVL